MTRVHSPSSPAHQQIGFSLIELMVVVVITLLMSLAVFGVLSTSESKKRTATSINDIDQAGSYAMYVMEKQIRSAGSGLHGGSATDYGCELEGSINGTPFLPAAAGSLPTEFSLLAGGAPVFKVVPIVVSSGEAKPYTTPWNGSTQGSDFFIIMAGSSGISEYPIPFTSPPTAASVTAANAIGVTANDVALLTDVTAANVPTPCILESVASSFTYSPGVTLIPLGGTYLTTSATPKAITAFSEGGAFLNLGQAPMMQVFGVGNNTTLFSYDILQGLRTTGGTAVSQALANGVFQMKALYAVDTSAAGDGTQVSWVNPNGLAGPSIGWDYATLTNGSAASLLKLKQIKAIRLGLVMRTQLPENVCPTGTSQTLRTSCTVISQAAPTLFAGVVDSTNVSLAYTVTLTPADLVYRYKTFETTIPLRNNLIFP